MKEPLILKREREYIEEEILLKRPFARIMSHSIGNTKNYDFIDITLDYGDIPFINEDVEIIDDIAKTCGFECSFVVSSHADRLEVTLHLMRKRGTK
jgi:hypothetical protein